MLNVAPNPNLPPFSRCNRTSSSSLVLVPATFRTHVSYRRSNPSPSASLLTCPSRRPLLSSSSPRFFRPTHFDVHVVSGRRHGGFKVGASRRRGRGGNLEADGLERSGEVMGYGGDDDYDDDDDYDEEEEEDEEEEGEMYSPFEKMARWHENKPPGFGVGKVYDTSIEDKLLEEMRQSRVAQAANINKLKNNPVPPAPPRKDQPHLKVTEALPSGFPVRLVNLPKKKNIHRDLRLAFKEVDGITGIHPAVSGNKKTRDPICTGFAFVYFKSEEHAMSFVQRFSRRSLTFGKVQKQIKCEMMSSRLPVNANTESASNTLVTSQISMPDREGEPDVHPDVYEPTSGSLEDLTSEKENDWNDEIELDEFETREDMETFDMSDFETFNTLESRIKIVTASSLTEQRGKAMVSRVAAKQKKPRPNPKNSAGKGKAEKVLKPEVPEDLTSQKENDWNDEIKLDEYETREDMETFDMSDFETFDTLESGTKIVNASSSTEQRGKATLTTVAAKQKKPQPNPKKSAGKEKAEKVLKPEVPGSAKRLKVKEKAVLTGVLSKYGAKAALNSNDVSLG